MVQTATQQQWPYSTSHKADLPTFFIIGATKSGTSSLYFYLKQHPDVFMPVVKEPHFFAYEPDTEVREVVAGQLRKNAFTVTQVERYRELFRNASVQRARGEASAMYIYLPGTAARIRSYLPEAKLIVILRNPVQRAYSAYLHQIREGKESLPTFIAALGAEEKRMAEGWAPLYHYQNMGFYFRQLSRFYEQFSTEQIKVFLYEDLERSSGEVTRAIFNFIGVDDTFVPDMKTKYNVTGVPQNRSLHRVYGFLKKPNAFKNWGKQFLSLTVRDRVKKRLVAQLEAKNLRKPPLSEEAKARLLAVYRPDILQLQDLLGRDLSHWLE